MTGGESSNTELLTCLEMARDVRALRSAASTPSGADMTKQPASSPSLPTVQPALRRLFADRGYEETSIRAIVTKARVNQAAINYHFGGKDGLYREVLRSGRCRRQRADTTDASR
jgi:actin-related protein